MILLLVLFVLVSVINRIMGNIGIVIICNVKKMGSDIYVLFKCKNYI